MLEYTKKSPISNVTLPFEGPEDKQDEAVGVLKTLGFNLLSTSGSIPWRSAFQEFAANESGACLIAARNKKGLTQANLSELTGIPHRHLSEIDLSPF